MQVEQLGVVHDLGGRQALDALELQLDVFLHVLGEGLGYQGEQGLLFRQQSLLIPFLLLHLVFKLVFLEIKLILFYQELGPALLLFLLAVVEQLDLALVALRLDVGPLQLGLHLPLYLLEVILLPL